MASSKELLQCVPSQRFVSLLLYCNESNSSKCGEDRDMKKRRKLQVTLWMESWKRLSRMKLKKYQDDLEDEAVNPEEESNNNPDDNDVEDEVVHNGKNCDCDDKVNKALINSLVTCSQTLYGCTQAVETLTKCKKGGEGHGSNYRVMQYSQCMTCTNSTSLMII